MNSRRNYLRIGIVGFLFLGAGVFLGWFLWPESPEPIVEYVAEVEEPEVKREVIGESVEGRSIEVFGFNRKADGSSETSANILFVGGIHGGYEWNSVLLAYEAIDHLTENPEVIPENTRVSIIPVLNPDGLYEIVGKEGRFSMADVEQEGKPFGTGRFNANDVDLNRNFDCKWAPESTWRGNPVSAGTRALSEPEARALRDYVLTERPSAVVFWHSKANTVYASECEEGILSETLDIMHAYADAAGYNKVEAFDAYPITGDAEGWLASLGIPAITVELKTHETVEWEQNRAGIEALFKYYEKK